MSDPFVHLFADEMLSESERGDPGPSAGFAGRLKAQVQTALEGRSFDEPARLGNLVYFVWPAPNHQLTSHFYEELFGWDLEAYPRASTSKAPLSLVASMLRTRVKRPRSGYGSPTFMRGPPMWPNLAASSMSRWSTRRAGRPRVPRRAGGSVQPLCAVRDVRLPTALWPQPR